MGLRGGRIHESTKNLALSPMGRQNPAMSTFSMKFSPMLDQNPGRGRLSGPSNT
jgi:hypothetical protein